MMKSLMKTSVLSLAFCLSAAVFCSCDDGGSEAAAKKSCKEICAEIVASDIAFPEMVEVNEDNFRLRYGLAEGDYAEYGVYWAGDGAMADVSA